MRTCPSCSKNFDDALVACPDDGTPLGSADPLLGLVIDGKYRLDGLIGQGGMGAVYRATQLALHRNVAIKVVRGNPSSHASALQRFEREAVAVARLKHPNVVAIYDVATSPDVGMYVVMEFLEGRSLRTELRRTGRVSLGHALKWFGEACDGVQAAHTAGVVHRDIKPDNVFLENTARGVVAKVLDFGIARFRGATSTEAVGLTASGAMIGTPAYMSPEQCAGAETTPASDVYALGCVLYEMLCGRPPFVGESMASILYQHVSMPPEPPSHHAYDVPPRVEAAILKAISKSPAQRFASAADFADALPHHDQTTETMPFATPIGDPRDSIAAGDPPSPANRSTISNNLPAEVTRFIGREVEVAAIADRLLEARMLTITGAGGIGKTRLAARVASAVLDRFPDGAWLVELASLTDGEGVAQAVATVIGVREGTGRSIGESLAAAVSSKRILVVLDNCEHVVEQSAAVSELLVRAGPGVFVLATSREPLAFAGEAVWQLGPLSVPERTADLSADRALEWEAVALFVDRAKSSKPSFALTDRVTLDVIRLCRRLDGIPLAIELAAARVSALAVSQIVAKLSEDFRILSGGRRSSLPRHQTLTATIDWSYDLLSQDEQRVLQRLSVFAGGWTLEAAESVCGGDVIDDADVFDLLAHLVDKSLVNADDREHSMRYAMPETIRQYSAAKLRAASDESPTSERHRAWVVEYAEEVFADFGGPDHERWHARMESEHDNVIAALEWGRRCGTGPDVNLRLCVAVGAFWDMYGYWNRGRRWLEETLASDCAFPDQLRARALFRAGVLANRQSDFERGEALLEECLPLLRVTSGPRVVAETLSQLGLIASARNEHARALELLQEALEIHRESSEPMFVAGALHEIGVVATNAGDLERASSCLHASLAIFREIEFAQGIAYALYELARVARARGVGALARERLAEVASVSQEGGFRQLVGLATSLLGTVRLDEDDADGARALFAEAIGVASALGAMQDVAQALEGLAKAWSALGDGTRALVAAGAASALREKMRHRLAPADQEELDEYLAMARATLTTEEAERALAEGRALPLERVVRALVQTIGFTRQDPD